MKSAANRRFDQYHRGMAIREVPNDLDETIRVNTEGDVQVTDEMRSVMEKLLDSDMADHELSFHDRKVAIFYGWVPS